MMVVVPCAMTLLECYRQNRPVQIDGKWYQVVSSRTVAGEKHIYDNFELVEIAND